MKELKMKNETDKVDLGVRTKRFALETIRFYSGLPSGDVSRVLGKQLLRSGTSVGAHYREARRAKSNADFVSKIEGALQELDESQYWLELIEESKLAVKGETLFLKKESDELIAIFVTIVRKVKSKSP